MAARISLPITVDLLPSDPAKVDAICLVIPVGKLGHGNPLRDFFMGLDSLLPVLVVVLGLVGLTLSTLCSGSLWRPPSCCSSGYVASAEKRPD